MFGDNLKHYRKRKGLTQNQLAKTLFVTRQSVSKWEQGLNEPDIETLKKLSAALGVSVEELIADDIAQAQKPRVDINRLLFTICSVLAACCVLSVFVLYRFLPSTIPAHYNIHGQADRYGDKNEVFLHIPALAVYFAVDLPIYLIFRRKPERVVSVISHSTLLAILSGYEIFLIILYSKMIASESVMSYASCLTTILLLAVSVMMLPAITPRNKILGVRTSFTLSDPAAWKKINLFAAICFTIASALILAFGMIFVYKLAFLNLTAYLLPAIVTIIYHEVIRRRSPKK